jgi:hypothetical protein
MQVRQGFETSGAWRIDEQVFECGIVAAVHAERGVDGLGPNVGRIDIQPKPGCPGAIA